MRELAVANCGHGRIEQRTIQVSEDLSDGPEWLDFPGVRRVFRILRETEYKKDGRQRRPETAYFVTSLPEGEAGPKRLLDLVRGYWGRWSTGFTTCGTSRCGRTPAACARARCEECWRPSRMSRSRSCGC